MTAVIKITNSWKSIIFILRNILEGEIKFLGSETQEKASDLLEKLMDIYFVIILHFIIGLLEDLSQFSQKF